MEFARIEGIPVPVSRVVLGTDWVRARRFVHVAGRLLTSPFTDRNRERDNFALLDGVVTAGCTAFDTARSYPDSERSLGTWLRARRLRERVVLISKGGHPGPGWTSRLRDAEIARDLDRSLKALQTDYIDLYLLHYDDETVAVEPLVDLLNRYVARGKIRAIGVSNWPTHRIARAISYARKTGQRAFVISSLQFSLASWRHPPWKGALSLSGDDRDADRQWYRTNDVSLLAYSSLAMGFFSRSRPYADGKPPPDGQRDADSVFVDANNFARLKRARELAMSRDVSTGQIALAWVLGYDPRVLAVVGARTVASYIDAAEACAISLSESERAWLSHGT